MLTADKKSQVRSGLNAPIELDGKRLEGRFESYTIDPVNVSPK